MKSSNAQLFESHLRNFLSLYEAKDLEAISEKLADTVVLRDWNQEVRGKELALAQFADNFEEAKSLTIDVSSVFTASNGACAEITIVVNKTESLRVIDVLTFNSAMEITSIVSYKGL
jgi:ketosteroid isomerase-like protein